MLTTLPIVLYTASFVLAAASPFLPRNLVLRSITASILAVIAGRLIEGGTHWSDQDVGYTIGLVMIFMFIVCLFLVLAGRVFLFESLGPLGRPATAGPERDTKGHKAIDRILFIFAGGITGLVFVIGLATILGGVSGGYFLDIGIAVTALIAAILSVMRLRKPSGLPCLAFSIVVATVSFLAAHQSRNIVESAEAFARGQPWCLIVPSARTEVAKMSDIGFYSLPKGGVRSHLVLIVQNGRPSPVAHWSIRRQRFMEGVNDFSLPGCQPRSDYVDHLENAAVQRRQ